jgi:membrane associated rhomboid family serine protease
MFSRSPFSLTPWVRRLVIANAVVYLLTITVFTGAWFIQLFAFSPLEAARQPWTFLTYMFLHGGFLHLAFNLLMLLFFGPAVEERMGSWAFARYYFFCGFGGAALSFAVALIAPAMILGASAAVLGVALAFALYWPNQQVFVFPLPFPVKVKWVLVMLIVLDMAPAIRELVGAPGDAVAHFAHLGGLLFGFVYLKGEALVAARARGARGRRSEARVLVHPSAQVAKQREAPDSRPDRGEATQREIDRVLDKISAKGLGSLTAEERRFLDDMSRQLKRE